MFGFISLIDSPKSVSGTLLPPFPEAEKGVPNHGIRREIEANRLNPPFLPVQPVRG
jgi:hypothetical protein